LDGAEGDGKVTEPELKEQEHEADDEWEVAGEKDGLAGVESKTFEKDGTAWVMVL
jgi:hypothetical protein